MACCQESQIARFAFANSDFGLDDRWPNVPKGLDHLQSEALAVHFRKAICSSTSPDLTGDSMVG